MHENFLLDSGNPPEVKKRSELALFKGHSKCAWDSKESFLEDLSWCSTKEDSVQAPLQGHAREKKELKGNAMHPIWYRGNGRRLKLMIRIWKSTANLRGRKTTYEEDLWRCKEYHIKKKEIICLHKRGNKKSIRHVQGEVQRLLRKGTTFFVGNGLIRWREKIKKKCWNIVWRRCKNIKKDPERLTEYNNRSK